MLVASRLKRASCPHRAGREGPLSEVPFIRTGSPSRRAAPSSSWSSHLPTAPPPNTTPLGVRFQHMNLGNTKVQPSSSRHNWKCPFVGLNNGRKFWNIWAEGLALIFNHCFLVFSNGSITSLRGHRTCSRMPCGRLCAGPARPWARTGGAERAEGAPAAGGFCTCVCRGP